MHKALRPRYQIGVLSIWGTWVREALRAWFDQAATPSLRLQGDFSGHPRRCSGIGGDFLAQEEQGES